MTAYIPLTATQLAVVDLEDVPKLFDINCKWCLSGTGYAHARQTLTGNVLMHKVICSADVVDHIDNDPLHNTKQNLRASTKQRNALNRGRDKNNASGYKGVSFNRLRKKWSAHLHAGSTVYIGLYATAIEAALAYDRAMTEWAGKYGQYNFGGVL